MPEIPFALPSGKHTGKTLAEVEAVDPRYLFWLLTHTKTTEPRTYAEVRSFLEAELIKAEAESKQRPRLWRAPNE